jgi:transcriptional regulator with XRE-family HTH domain
MHDEMAINAQQLRSLREQRGWSQEQLADVSGLSARTIQRVEATGAASLETRMALAAALELAPADLLVPAQASPAALLPPVHPTAVRPWRGQNPLRAAILLILLLVFVQMIFGYIVGRDMANRDDARAQKEAAGGGR